MQRCWFITLFTYQENQYANIDNIGFAELNALSSYSRFTDFTDFTDFSGCHFKLKSISTKYLFELIPMRLPK